MLIRRLVPTALATLVAAASLAGCTGNPDNTGPLPDAGGLVDTAAERLRGLTDVSFHFRSNGALPGLPVREVEGTASREGGPDGTAQGEADVQAPAGRTQYTFDLDGETLRLTDPDEADAPAVERTVPQAFAPARLLDPERGLRQLLLAATDLRTETRENLADVETYRVGGGLAHDAIAAVVPTVHDDVSVKFWIAPGTGRLMRVWVQVPPRQKNEGAVQLELALTRHNDTGATQRQRVPSGGSSPSTR
ncbi:hypothetical protein B1813_18100 [Saccharomonospora piscinae]|uniref:Lipoprotein LprG n=1 Tax=Saccharomonospora piscinae TaxID=687388 RepID=A0A1V8ZZK9_SACPI|nr:LppX_LprAFG lipoprotein [Saccharomonospora piscinae]OQO90332.1 hypothetical protein B1813_18100 [Saccharomonospora piscinae]